MSEPTPAKTNADRAREIVEGWDHDLHPYESAARRVATALDAAELRGAERMRERCARVASTYRIARHHGQIVADGLRAIPLTEEPAAAPGGTP